MNETRKDFMLIGVGGGGCRIAAATLAEFGTGLQAVGCDTDALATRSIAAMRCLLLGASRYDGHGSGGDMVKGRTAVQDDLEHLRQAFAGVRTAVVVTTLGGGTGGGATPEILRLLRNGGAHTLCFATLPFGFEGSARQTAATRALALLEENSDALVVVSLDSLFQDAGAHDLGRAIPQAESIMSAGLSLLWRLVLSPGFIALDIETLHGLLGQCGGRCRFAVATAEGSERAAEAVARLARSALLGKGAGFGGAQAMALGILGGSDLCLAELTTISQRIESALPSGCQLHLGTVLDATLAGRLQLVALLFDAWHGTPTKVDDGAATHSIDEILPTVPSGGTAKRRRRAAQGSRLSFGATGRGRFKDIEATLRDGEDLDIPTYQRRGLTLDR